MKLESFLRALGAPVQDVEEETFELFAQDLPSGNLGFIDSRATTLELSIGGRDFTIHQSPGVLSSNRAGGTTGAVVWKITPLFAEWLASSSTASNPLFVHGVLSPSSVILELGCGISGLVGLALAPRIARYVLTDQPYVAKLVEQNVAENWAAAHTSTSAPAAKAARPGGKSARASRTPSRTPTPTRGSPTAPSPSGRREATPKGKIQFTPLDWETDQATPSLTGTASATSFDAVLACDCIYNEALVEPFVTTCADLCRLRSATNLTAQGDDGEVTPAEPCVCVISQQLRDPLVFEAWLTHFSRSFHTWRVPDEMLVPGLRSNSGFVVHVGVLKGDISLLPEKAGQV